MAARPQRRTRRQAPAAIHAAGSPRPLIWPVAVIVGTIVAVYWNSLPVPFHFDDFAAIVENARIRSLERLGEVLSPANDDSPAAGRPLLNLSFALNYAFGGLAVPGYHLVNIAIHAACALLLYALIRHTFTLPAFEGTSWRAGAVPVAAASALIWALHPLQTTAVTYISARSELLMGLWYLATVLAGARAYGSPVPGRWQALAVAACAAGMASKETMATAPVMLLLYDRAFRFGSVREAVRERWRFYAALAVTWCVLAALVWSGPRAVSAGFGAGISPWTYLLHQSAMVTEYLRTAFWPSPIVFAYGEPQAIALRDVLPQALFVLGLLGTAAWVWIARPRAGFPGVWFFVILAPSSSVVPVATEVGAGRRMYLPLAGVVVLTVVLARAVWRAYAGTTSPRRGLAVSVTGVTLVCALLGIQTVRWNTVYQSPEALWRSALEAWPSALAHRNLATALQMAGRRAEALPHLEATLAEHPEMGYRVGAELAGLGRHAEAVPVLEKYLATPQEPNDTLAARYVLGRALSAGGKHAAAAEQFAAVLRARPTDERAQLGLAEALFATRDYERAIAAYTAYAARQPDLPGVWTNLGIARLSTGDADAAVEAFRRALSLQPGERSALVNLAAALTEAGRPAEAEAYAAQAVAVAPDNPAARLLYGELLEHRGQRAAAREQFRRALEIDPANREAAVALGDAR